MLRVFLVFLSLRLSVALPAALTCPSLCSLIAWCAPWSTRGDRRSISVADKGLAPRSMCPLTGLACILLTRMSTSERRVGEGRFFFVSPPCLLFPLFYFAWRCAQPLGAIAQEGCWRCVNPFRTMPLHYRNEGCYSPRKPRYPPSARCLSTSERRVGEGRFFFVSPPLSSFPFILFCLALCTIIACNCTRGVLALCVQCFVDASAPRRSLERCRRAQRAGCRRDGRKHGGNCTETGSFSHRPPRSPPRGEHAACRRTVPSSCAGGDGKTRPRKRQMQGKNVICNDLCAKSACISKKKPTFAVELSFYYCQPHHAKKITSFLHGAAHLGGGAHGGRPPQAQ